MMNDDERDMIGLGHLTVQPESADDALDAHDDDYLIECSNDECDEPHIVGTDLSRYLSVELDLRGEPTMSFEGPIGDGFTYPRETKALAAFLARHVDTEGDA